MTRTSRNASPSRVTVPAEPTLDVVVERLMDSETGEKRYELEYEIFWSE